jgi:zinc transporter, ZIP family
MQTLLFAAVAAGSILVGAVAGVFFETPQAVRAALLAFAAGALLTATAFELFEPARETAGLAKASIAFGVGAGVFTLVDWLTDRVCGERQGVGLALVAAVTLDGVPENLALGVTLQGTGSYALLVAIVASNLPEALGGAAALREGGSPPARTILIWAAVAGLLVVSLVAGQALAAPLSEDAIAMLLAFAAGAVLASVADAVMPEAFREGGPLVALATAAGFLVAYGLAT